MLKTKIRELRMERHMEQSELARLVDVRRETIGRLGRGQYNPSLKLAMDIAQVFGATVEDMLALAQERGEAPFLILLDGITDPHNLGAIIRTAECVGAHGVIVPERRSVGLTPAAVKASAGAVEHVHVARVVNLTRTLEQLQVKNIWTYAVTMDGDDYDQVDFSGGVALVIGAEGEGISRLGEMLDLGVKLDLVQKSGSWFNMGDIRLGQGRDAAKQYFRDHPDEADKLEAAIRRDFHKLMSSQSKIAAKAAGRAVDVSADDFDDDAD